MHAGSPEKKPLEASIASALRTVATEQAGVAALAAALENGLAEPFAHAVDIISHIDGLLFGERRTFSALGREQKRDQRRSELDD